MVLGAARGPAGRLVQNMFKVKKVFLIIVNGFARHSHLHY